VRGWIIAVGAAVVATGAGVAGVAALGGSDDKSGSDGNAAEPAVEQSTVEVVRRDLARVEQLDGTVGHGDSKPLVLAAEGTLTALPEPGNVIEPGDVVAEVDGRPVIALEGAFPLWRALGPGVADGKDVLQVEYMLATLGYAQEYDITVDDEWTSATTDAVEAFQEDHGQDDDGVIDLGELIFIDAPVRVADVTGVAGQPASEAGISVTSTEQSVHVDLDAADADLVSIDARVEVELPSGETVTGTVSAIGSAQTDEASGETTLPVTLTLSHAPALSDGTPVDVNVEVAAAENVLAVPAEALLALAEGGYAVEVVDSSAGTHLVGVTVGVFADGLVEIDGDVRAGTKVVVPE
jgi:hypothetical protein